VDNTYKCDSALGASCPNSTASESTATCDASFPNACVPSRSATGADRKHYRVDSYIVPSAVTNGRTLKIVTVVVRDGDHPSARPYARITSTFDQSTG
jgi:hypothetical protein